MKRSQRDITSFFGPATKRSAAALQIPILEDPDDPPEPAVAAATDQPSAEAAEPAVAVAFNQPSAAAAEPVVAPASNQLSTAAGEPDIAPASSQPSAAFAEPDVAALLAVNIFDVNDIGYVLRLRDIQYITIHYSLKLNNLSKITLANYWYSEKVFFIL